MPNATTQIDTQVRNHPSRDPRPLPVAPETRWPPPQGQWTYQDWLRLPDDGWQYEIIQGVLYMVPVPTTTHQRVSRNLEVAMCNFVQEFHHGEVFDAPTDVYLPTGWHNQRAGCRRRS